MKRILVLAVFALAAVPAATHAQSAMARILFEEAEAAFANNDLTTTVSKLNEAQRVLGAPNAPILRLRITAREQYLRGTPNYDYAQLEAVRADCNTYSQRFANDNQWIDYTREIHPLCQRLTSYPATRAAREAQLQAERDRVAQAQAAQRAREEEARQAQARALAEQQDFIRRRVPELEAMAASRRTRGWIWLGVGVGAGYLAAQNLPKAFGDDEASGMELALAIVMPTAAIGSLIASWLSFDEAGLYSNMARDMRRRNPNLFSVAPTYSPGSGSVGLAVNLQF